MLPANVIVDKLLATPTVAPTAAADRLGILRKAVLSEETVPTLHQLVDEIFGALLLAIPLKPQIRDVECVIVERAALEFAFVLACSLWTSGADA